MMNTKTMAGLKSILLFAALVLVFFACKREHKVVKEVFDDGTPRIVSYYSDDSPEAELLKETVFFPSGNKHMEGTYKDGLRDGKWTSWYEDGAVWSEGYFKEDLGHGVRTTYYPNGKVRYQGMMEMGERKGVWKFFDEEGALVQEVNYDNPQPTQPE